MFNINQAITNDDNLYFFNEDTQRMEFKYKNDILLEYQALFSAVFPGLNLDASTPQGQIITDLVQTDLSTIANYENELNSFFFGGTGQYLDMWAWNLFGVKRKKGIPTEAIIRVTGVSGTVVPNDFLITDGNLEYKITQQVTIPPSGTIDVLFKATTISSDISAPNTINQFVVIVDGVETINNPNMSTPAILRESDNELFTRCATFGATATNSTFRSIMSNIAQVTGTTKLTGAENYTDDPVVFKNITLTPHSICICVKGATDTEIATAILNSRSTGCDMVGDTSVTIMENGVEYTYKFYRPTLVPLKVKVEARVDIDSPTNWEEIIKSNVRIFVDSQNIASLLTQPNLAKYLYRNVNSFDIIDLKFSKLDDPLSYQDIQLDLNQEASILNTDIEVVQV